MYKAAASFFKNIMRECSFRPINDQGANAAVVSCPQEHRNDTGELREFIITGKVAVPRKSSVQWIHLNGRVLVKGDPDDGCSIVDCWGETALADCALADGIDLSAAAVRLAYRDGQAEVRIRGLLRIGTKDDVEAGGRIDARLHYCTDDPRGVCLGTLLQDAYIRFGDSISFNGATVKFELRTRHFGQPIPLPYSIDELDEFLFQSDTPIPVGIMDIRGIPGQPITFSVSASAAATDPVRLCLHVFPARLCVPFFGNETILFIHGDSCDAPFTVDMHGPWKAGISSNVRMQLMAPAGKPLLQGTAALNGILSSRGWREAQLSIGAQLIHATIFPESPWPQELPDQKISFTVFPDRGAAMNVTMHPLRFGPILIQIPGDSNAPLEATLGLRGFRFSGKISLFSEPFPGELDINVIEIDNSCRIWISAHGSEAAVAAWLEKAAKAAHLRLVGSAGACMEFQLLSQDGDQSLSGPAVTIILT